MSSLMCINVRKMYYSPLPHISRYLCGGKDTDMDQIRSKRDDSQASSVMI